MNVLHSIVLAGLLLLLAVSADASNDPATHDAATRRPATLRIPARFNRATGVVCELAGPLHDQMQNVIKNWLLLAPDHNPALLDMFADRDRQPYRNLLPWSGEFAGKYLTACTQIIRVSHDAALQAKVQQFVDRLVTLQDEDGYLGPLPKAYRLAATAPNVAGGGTWDAWGHYHIMLGLLLWHDQTGDTTALRCAERIGDLLCHHFLGGGRHVADMGSPDQNQAVIHGLCRLYEETGTPRYLDLAEQIVTEFELPGAGDYLRTALAGQEFYATPKPRWESLHAILGLAELYHITGRDEYRRAFEHIWWSIVKLDRHNNGGFSSGEQAVGDPYNGAPIETCCTIAWLATSVEMLRLTGSSLVADEMELSTFNSVVGLHSPDGRWSTYNTPMDGQRIPNTQDISFQIRPGAEQLNCCSVNAARGFGMISDWALMTETGPAEASPTLVLNWYGPSTFTAQVATTHVSIRQDTDYPRSGHIVLHVDPPRRTKFTLNAYPLLVGAHEGGREWCRVARRRRDLLRLRAPVATWRSRHH
ncbi:MAG: glycoside hydrolase family 127 protein [Abitibacteriaceae bacterium]|nr:glycoside hydrolase family 127 protein [Abditibacteriaceae bacterium]